MKPSIKLLSMLLFILSLVGCGLKGPLYFPTNGAMALTQLQLFDKIA
ncbi:MULTISPECIES: LPS translocon maturation chaperone LptM [unclassified Gilliamella]|jgi:predicted small lipoprotein YifL|nr:lipoprotein [Gilliamella apicola]KFA59365.1 hypothetical protein GAPWKB11_0108 [Gilliamella apicola]